MAAVNISEVKILRTKPQLKNIDDLFGLDAVAEPGKIKIQDIPVNNFVPFTRHPFRLHEGERLDDMVESVKANGVLVPVIARRKAGSDGEAVEILAGHNRINAAKLAGLVTVPAIVLDGISDEEAMVYVVETNLIQRSFADMRHSEKAAVIALHHSRMFSQGKRSDIFEQLRALEYPDAAEALASTQDDQDETGAHERNHTGDKIGAMYSLSRNTIARYLRISQLIGPLKMMLDNDKITFLAAVELSFLTRQEQTWLSECLEDGFSVSTAKAAVLREQSKAGMLDAEATAKILAGQNAGTEKKAYKIKINSEIYGKFFKPEQSVKEIENIVKDALTLYFSDNRSGQGA